MSLPTGRWANRSWIVLTIAVVNLRHMLYSASLAPYLASLSTRWKALLSYLLTDEAYAPTIIRYEQEGKTAYSHWFLLGAGLTLWMDWQISTALGIWLLAGYLYSKRISETEARANEINARYMQAQELLSQYVQKIESLRASATLIKDLTPLSGLVKLDRLDIGRTPVSASRSPTSTNFLSRTPPSTPPSPTPPSSTPPASASPSSATAIPRPATSPTRRPWPGPTVCPPTSPCAPSP